MKTKKSVKDRWSKTPVTDHQPFCEPNCQDSGNGSSRSMCRSSKRIQNMQKSTTSPGQIGLVDSAYDADEESVTPNSSPDQQTEKNKDPYEMDMSDDDTPIVKTKQRRKNDKKIVKKQQLATKKLKKAKSSPSASKKSNPTSTPVLHSSGSVALKTQESQAANSLSVTPEVTPILPYKSHECALPSDDSFATPQIHRPSKKRSLQPDSLTNSCGQLSYSTHGDSGISLSPVSKKHRLTSDTEKHIPELESRSSKSQKKNILVHKVKKEQKHSSSVFDIHKMKKKNIFSPVTEMNVPELHKTDKNFKKFKTRDDSCFGFDSLGSPEIASENSPPAKPRRPKNAEKVKKSAPITAYRLVHTNSSDSSTCVINEMMLSLDSESSPENVNRTKSASPTLFSDSFSADSESLMMEVNKGFERSYSKPSKVKRIKKKATVTKLDVWANHFNMEIEDIEKFDLNIE